MRFSSPKVFVQSVEAFFPESAVVIDPLGDVLERAGVEMAGPPLRVAAAGDQAGALEHFEVLGDRRHAHVERLGERGDRRLAVVRETGEDRTPGRIGEGGEGQAEMIAVHIQPTS